MLHHSGLLLASSLWFYRWEFGIHNCGRVPAVPAME